MKHDVSKNAAENRNKTKRSFSHTVPKKHLEQWLMADNFLMNTCWLMRVFQMTAQRFHSNLWNSKQCLTTFLTSTRWLPDNSWMITCEAVRSCAQPKNRKAIPMWEKQWHTWSSRNWEKVICEKKQWYITFLIVCMGYFIKRNCANCQERWAGIFI